MATLLKSCRGLLGLLTMLGLVAGFAAGGAFAPVMSQAMAAVPIAIVPTAALPNAALPNAAVHAAAVHAAEVPAMVAGAVDAARKCDDCEPAQPDVAAGMCSLAFCGGLASVSPLGRAVRGPSAKAPPPLYNARFALTHSDAPDPYPPRLSA